MKKGKLKSSPAPKSRSTQSREPEALVVKEYRYAGAVGLASAIILGVLVYSNSFNCSFHFDDVNNIVDNLNIRNISDVNAWWNDNPGRRVAVFTFVLNYHFNRFDVSYWHLVNLGIHLINTCLVYWLTWLIFSTPGLQGNPLVRHKKILAIFTALLFVSHPLATQSVTYIVQRMTSLAALFYLLSLCLYVKARLPETGKTLKYLHFAGSFTAFCLALQTKENTYSLPVAVVLFEICFFNARKMSFNLKDYRVALAALAFTGFILFTFLRYSSSIFKPIPPSTVNDFRTVTSVNYLFTQFNVIVKYIGLLILPINQNLDYDFPLSTTFFQARTIFSFLMLSALAVLGIYLFKRNRLLSFGIGWFFITISIESSIIPISDLIFEHRTYLPSFGFFLMLSTSIFLLFWDKYKMLSLALLSLIIGSNAWLTFQRNKVWKDELTLWSDVVSKSPQKARGYDSRGNAYNKIGKYEQAFNDFNKAITLQPNYSTAYNNRGNVFNRDGKYKQALEDYTKAIELQPNYASAYSNRGHVNCKLKKYEEALNDINKALSLKPNYPVAYLNRGVVFNGTAQYQQAMDDFNKAIQLQPNYTEAYYNRGVTYGKLAQVDNAIADYSTTIALDSSYAQAYYNRAIIYDNLEQRDKAIQDYSKAIEFDPKFASAWYNRGNAYTKLGQLEKSIADFTKVIDINPKNLNAWYNRGNAYVKLEKWDKAIADYSKTLEIDPKNASALFNREIALKKLRSVK
jgi:tetratricopeptide (TPR) repeat protein